MDKFDPNQWTSRFAKSNTVFCIKELINVSKETVVFTKNKNYKVAVVGLDRIMNGLITLHNAGCINSKPFLCGLSFAEGEIIACGFDDAPESKRRETALAAFEDARDYSSKGMKDLSETSIKALRSGMSFKSYKNEFEPDFPASVISELLEPTVQRLSALLD